MGSTGHRCAQRALLCPADAPLTRLAPFHPSQGAVTVKDMKAASIAANSGTQAKWETNNMEAAKLSACEMSDDELMMAKQAFFMTDKDGSGAIDRDELAMMIKSLGQNPTKHMIDEIMREADGGADHDGDGKIGLREFLQWYGRKLKTKKDTSKEDVQDVYRALGGDFGEASEASAGGEKKVVTKEEFAAALKEHYDLDVDVNELFAMHVGKELKMADFEELLMPPKDGKK